MERVDGPPHGRWIGTETRGVLGRRHDGAAAEQRVQRGLVADLEGEAEADCRIRSGRAEIDRAADGAGQGRRRLLDGHDRSG